MQKFVSSVPDAYALDVEGMECLECLGLIHNIGYVVLLVNFQERFLEFFSRNPEPELSVFFEKERAWFDGFDHFRRATRCWKPGAFRNPSARS